MNEQRIEQRGEPRPLQRPEFSAMPPDTRSSAGYTGDPAAPAASDASMNPVAQPVTKKRPSMVREIIETLLLAVIIFVAVRAVVLNFRVDGHSMEPSLDNNEMLLVNRNAYFAFDEDKWFGWIPGVETDGSDDPTFPFGKPERGDIVVLNPPTSASADKPYIKRVVGEPGDTIELQNGSVFINGEQIDEPYLEGLETNCRPTQTCGPLTVPEDAVFVLGDNRGNSEDSRFFGVVPIENIIGKAWLTYWPVGEIELVPHEEYPELSN